jgi:hypothetical protein
MRYLCLHLGNFLFSVTMEVILIKKSFHVYINMTRSVCTTSTVVPESWVVMKVYNNRDLILRYGNIFKKKIEINPALCNI